MLLPSANATNPSLLIIECGTTAIVIASAFTWPRLASNTFARFEKAFAHLAHRQRLAVASVGLSVLLLRLAILPLLPIPIPLFPTISASCFPATPSLTAGSPIPPRRCGPISKASTSPCSPPTCPCTFPAQGLVLAAGKVLFGNPWFAPHHQRTHVRSHLLDAAGMAAGELGLSGRHHCGRRVWGYSVIGSTPITPPARLRTWRGLVLGALPRFMKTARLRYALLMANRVPSSSCPVLTKAAAGSACIIVLGPLGVRGKTGQSTGSSCVSHATRCSAGCRRGMDWLLRLQGPSATRSPRLTPSTATLTPWLLITCGKIRGPSPIPARGHAELLSQRRARLSSPEIDSLTGFLPMNAGHGRFVVHVLYKHPPTHSADHGAPYFS